MSGRRLVCNTFCLKFLKLLHTHTTHIHILLRAKFLVRTKHTLPHSREFRLAAKWRRSGLLLFALFQAVPTLLPLPWLVARMKQTKSNRCNFRTSRCPSSWPHWHVSATMFNVSRWPWLAGPPPVWYRWKPLTTPPVGRLEVNKRTCLFMLAMFQAKCDIKFSWKATSV